MNQTTKLAGWNAVVHLPASYNTSTQSYPVIYFIPGTGEVGTNAALLLNYGPNAYISAGWDGKINGREYIVISIQPPTYWPRPYSIGLVLNAASAAYRIDKRKVAATGLSMGGWAWNTFVTYKPTAADFSYVDRISTVVNIQGVKPEDNWDATPPYPTKFIDWAKRGGKELCLEQKYDGRDMLRLAETMNGAVPGSAKHIITEWGNGGHCCWNEAYLGNFKIDGRNMYAWIDDALYGAAVPNVAPIVNAGADQAIIRPINTATLQATATDADGSIVGTTWAVVSGSGVFSDAAGLRTVVTGLSLGDNVFRIAATDNKGAVGIDDVVITVSDVVQPPKVAKYVLYNDGTWAGV